MGNLTREQILARKMGQDVVEIEGGTVTVRGLNRHEAMTAAAIEDHYERDAFLLASGLVDPAMSVEDVKAWGEVDNTNTLETVSRRIGELSGMVEGAGKSRVPRAGRRS